MKRWVNVLALLAIAVCSVAILPYVHGISAEEAAAAVAGADNALQSAFVTVSDTEKVGVNMSSLMSRLNEAGLYLNMAEEALNGGNYSAAVNEAATSEALAVGVARDAAAMKSGVAGWLSNTMFTLVIGFLSAGLLVVVLLSMWFWFKRYYDRKLAESRPEVTP